MQIIDIMEISAGQNLKLHINYSLTPHKLKDTQQKVKLSMEAIEVSKHIEK